ncbi:hypothetical protein Tco_0733389 [Tanacetum coccineum]
MKCTGEESFATPRKNRARKNQEVANSRSDRTISITPLHHASPKPVDETVISAPKATTGIVAEESQTANLEKEWGLRDDLRISSFRACKETIIHLAIPTKDEYLGSLSNMELVSAYLSVFRTVRLIPRNDLQRMMQTNDGLSKQLSLIDSVHSSCEDKERELVNQLKEMEKERYDWRRTASELVENIKVLEGEIEPKSWRLADAKERVRQLEGENSKLVSDLAQAEMDHHKLI